MKFLIKAEATQSIGFGHIKRQINLARAFEKRGIEVIFAVKEQNALTRRVSYQVSQCSTAQDLVTLGKDCRAVIIDEPCFPSDWHPELEIFDCIIGIDELGPLRDHLDLHFCTTLLGLKNRLETRGKTREYIGPKYFIFEELHESASKPCENSVLLSFGGSDPGRLTEKFLQGLVDQQNLEASQWIGILGPGFSKTYGDLLRENFGFVHWVDGPPSLAPYLRLCSRIICAGGVTPYEALRLGCYPYILAQKQEQAETGQQLEDEGLAVLFGDCDRIDWSRFKASFLGPNHRSDEASALNHFQALMEGDSMRRVVDTIINHVQS